MNRLLVILLGIAGMFLPGCGEDAIPYREVKRIDDRITEKELASFLSIVDSLPEKKLPHLALVGPPPEWSSGRTLPVSELVREEQKAIRDRTQISKLARPWGQSLYLRRALRRERMTVEQFVGLTVALGVALSRDEVREDCDLNQVITRGKKVIADIEKVPDVYSSLTEDRAYYFVEQAAWIPLLHLAQRLRLVPPENRELAKLHAEKLKAIFPEEFTTNPLASYSKLLEDQGIPFEELPETGTDSRIAWSRDQAAAEEGSQQTPEE